MLAVPRTASARGELFSSNDLVVASSTVVPVGSAKYCGVQFTETHPDAAAVRSRFLLPRSVPWTLISVAYPEDAEGCSLSGSNKAALIMNAGGKLVRHLALADDPTFAPFLSLVCQPSSAKKLIDRLRDTAPKPDAKDPPPFGLVMATFFTSDRSKGNPKEANSIWTSKTSSSRVAHALFYRGDACDLSLVSDATIVDPQPEEDDEPQGHKLFEATFSTKIPEYASNVVRLEYIRRTLVEGEKVERLDYCTGLLVTPNLLLTAGHCAIDDGKQICKESGEGCESYSADLERPTGRGDLVSFPVKKLLSLGSTDPATLPPEKDFAWFRVWTFDNAPVGKIDPAPAAASSPLLILSYPDGLELYSSQECQELLRSSGLAWHYCEAVQGSSGAPIWRSKAPIGLHVRPVRHCAGRWERGFEAVEKIWENRGLSTRPCVGEMVLMETIFQAYCSDSDRKWEEKPECKLIGSFTYSYTDKYEQFDE